MKKRHKVAKAHRHKEKVVKNLIFFLCYVILLVGISFSPIYSDVNLAKVAQEVDAQYLKTIVSDLSNLGSRVPGYKGNEEASEYIENIFQKIGLENVKSEDFSVTVPVDKGASLVVSNSRKELQLYCLWPNLIRTSSLPSAGITSQIIDGRTGNFKDLNGKTIQGRVVLLDFNCGNRWLDISMLGAKAFVFIEPKDTTRIEAEKKYLNLPLNIPRYWISRWDGLYLRKSIKESDGKLDVRLNAKMDWERKITKNVLGWISGNDPELKKEVVVIEAYYDSISVVPSIAPGADSACSIAALIQIAKILRNNPPSRTVLFLAASGHFLERRGIDAFLQAHCRKKEPFKSRITEPMDIKLFLCIDLSSHNNELVIYHDMDTDKNLGYFASFGKTFMSFADEMGKIFNKSRDDVLINGISPEKGLNIDSITAGKISTDAGIIGVCGIPALCFITAHDSRRLVDTPLDRVGTVDFKNLFTQIKHISCLFHTALNKKELFPDVRVKFKDGLCTLKGRIVTFDPRKSFVPDEPVAGGVAVLKLLGRTTEVFKGVRPELIELTDEDGSFEISRARGGGSRLEAYSLDSESGDIVYAPDMGVYGDEMYPIEFDIGWRFVEHTIVLFPCIATNVYELLDPRYLAQLDNIDVFDEGNSVPSSYGYSFIEVKPWDWTSSIETYGVVYSLPDTNLKLAFGAGSLGMRLLLLNSKDAETKVNSEGDGFLISRDGAIENTSFRAAKDMLLLNQFRMENLEKYGISNDRLWHLHKKAEQALQKAGQAKENKIWDEFIKYSRRAVGIESRAYPDVKATANDVIKGIIFYLALLIPFAYFMERLLFGFVDIKKQIGGIAG
ncbi:M28 family peptidase, partial [bacterium]|nr:M28 family peptidase [bacterium]